MLNFTRDQGATNQITMRYHLTVVRMARIKKTINSKCWWVRMWLKVIFKIYTNLISNLDVFYLPGIHFSIMLVSAQMMLSLTTLMWLSTQTGPKYYIILFYFHVLFTMQNCINYSLVLCPYSSSTNFT